MWQLHFRFSVTYYFYSYFLGFDDEALFVTFRNFFQNIHLCLCQS